MIATRKIVLQSGDSLRVTGGVGVFLTAHYVDLAPGAGAGLPGSVVLACDGDSPTTLVASPSSNNKRIVGEVSWANTTGADIDLRIDLRRGGEDYPIKLGYASANESDFL